MSELYVVRLTDRAKAARRSQYLYIKKKDGKPAADYWFEALRARLRLLEFKPLLVMSHIAFYTIDDEARTVWVIDLVHGRNQERLKQYQPTR